MRRRDEKDKETEMHEEAQPAKQTGKTLACLAILGILARWAPTLCSLIVVVVMLNYAQYAWRMLVRLPDRETAELLALAGVTLGIGFLAKLGVAPLILTATILIVTLPLWDMARRRRPNEAAASEGADRSQEDDRFTG
jgi:ABC-type Fe3+ transport system permease subunit